MASGGGTTVSSCRMTVKLVRWTSASIGFWTTRSIQKVSKNSFNRFQERTCFLTTNNGFTTPFQLFLTAFVFAKRDPGFFTVFPNVVTVLRAITTQPHTCLSWDTKP